MSTVKDFYNAINEFAPFSTAMSWDNSGIIVGDPDEEVSSVITALDITTETVREAHEKGVQLIISHHPVIFHPLKSLSPDSVPAMLIRYGIAAICVHTPFDMAPCGMNKGLRDILWDKLGFCDAEPLEVTGDGLSIGMIYTLASPIEPEMAAEIIGNALGCTVVRFNRGGRVIRRLAVSSGAGGSLCALAAQKGADALAAGDFKHSDFVDSLNSGFTVIDCGHYHTERIFSGMMKGLLSPLFPDVNITETSKGDDPVSYYPVGSED